jgi:C-terminal processing protease CtpA/Prc
MNRYTWSGLLTLILLLFLAACTEAEATPTPAPVQESTAVAESTATPTPTAAPATAVPVPTEEPNEPAPAPTAEEPNTTTYNHITNDEGGPVSITGIVTYTAPFFTDGVAAPLVILEDQTGFVDRNEEYIFPVASQTLGQITTDFYTSPFSYSVALPIEPQGAFRDVDFDDTEEQGVQLFAVAYWNNTFGDPFLEERDLGGGGWSTAYASTIVSTDPEQEREIIGGTLLIYAQDDQQSFPSDFGPDGLLFTGDETMVALPAGYTLVHLDTTPFTFDRRRNPQVDLVEPEGAALVDYSAESYTAAFDALVDQLINEYAFTDYKAINWEELRTEFRPRFEEADANSDELAYRRALRDFAWAIPDGHVSGPFIDDDFRDAAIGGLGMALRETSDGRIIVTYLSPGGAAESAGIQLGAQILTINGQPTADFVSQTVSYFSPYSTAHTQRLDQLFFATRYPLDTEVTLTYQNPDANEQSAKLTADFDPDSFDHWLDQDGRDGFELPVEYSLLDEGVGYVEIFSFLDNDLLTVQLWERMLQEMNENEVPALIIDMRRNGGGRGFLADAMAAYFFDEELVLGNAAFYDEERGEFYLNEDYENTFILPPDETLRYDGPIVVLVGPSCASACEFFSYDMTLNGRATIIGHYPTAGLGGSVDEVKMPADEMFRFTQGRALDADGNIHIEGIGVIPNIVVPVTVENLLSEEDAVLQAALAFLLGAEEAGAPLTAGESVSGVLLPNTRIRHTVTLTAGDTINLILESTNGADQVVMRVFDENGNLLGETDPDTAVGFVDIPIEQDLIFIVEAAAADDSQTVEYTLTIEKP